MTISGFPPVTRYIGMMAVVAAIGIAGCQRSPDATTAAPMANTAPMPAMGTSNGMNPPVATETVLKVAVSLSPAVAKKAAPNDVVFVFARATSGPRMPLAIVRMHVKDLPATVVLNDSQGMGPQMKLSSAPEIIVVARVSKSGMADARNGDLEGMSAPVANGTKTISISIDKVLTGQKASQAPHV